MRRLIHLVMGACLIMTATAARANEIQLLIDSSLAADSNVFRLPSSPNVDSEIADGVWSIRPILKARDKNGRGTYEITYNPVYRQYFTQTELSRLDQHGQLTASYSFSPADIVRLNFRGFSAEGTRFIESDETGEVISQDPGDQQSDHAAVDVAFVHSFNRRIRLNASAEFQWYGFDRQFREDDPVVEVDNRSLGGLLGMEYSLGTRTTVGTGLRASWQQFLGERVPEAEELAGEPVFRRPPSRTIFSTLFFSFAHTFSKTLSLNFAIGPTLSDTEVDTDANQGIEVARYPMADLGAGAPPGMRYAFFEPGDCSGGNYFRCDWASGSPSLFGTQAQFDDRKQVFYSDTALEFLSGTDTDFRFFATASLVKRWSKVVANLSYQRRDSAGSSQGTSSILDTLKLRVDWRPDPQWSVSGQVAYVARTNTSLIPEFQLWIQSVSPVPPGAPVAEANEYRVSTQNSTFDTDTFQTYLTGRYLVNKKLTLNARFLYRMQKSETRTSTQNRDFQVFVLSVGLLYQFDAYRF